MNTVLQILWGALGFVYACAFVSIVIDGFRGQRASAPVDPEGGPSGISARNVDAYLARQAEGKEHWTS